MMNRIGKIINTFAAVLILNPLACAQKTVPADKPATINEAFDQKIAATINFTVPLMSVEELNQADKRQLYILDARERTEFAVSHIPGARYIGYNQFDPATILDIPKNAEIVLYCSIGYRSEKIGERLKKMGYEKIFNLYGSIFEWANQGLPLEDARGATTNDLHTYNRNWSKWVDNKNVNKTW